MGEVCLKASKFLILMDGREYSTRKRNNALARGKIKHPEKNRSYPGWHSRFNLSVGRQGRGKLWIYE